MTIHRLLVDILSYYFVNIKDNGAGKVGQKIKYIKQNKEVNILELLHFQNHIASLGV